jgi:hypothetical protein
MSSVTLAESAKLSQNELVAGVIENIITVNRMYEMLPFDGIEGNALAYDRENALGPVATAGVGTTDGVIGSLVSGGTNTAERTAAKDPATFTQVTANLTTILGDAEVNGLIQATRSNINNQTAVQIASKSKSAGRKYQNLLINGDGANYTFAGLIALCPGGQTIDTGTDGSYLSFDIIDETMDAVVDKDGEVDYLTMHQRTIRTMNKLLRDLGGTSAQDAIKLPSGKEVPAYRGSPVFRNDYIPTNVARGVGTGDSAATSYVFAGNFDDGSRQHGIAGLTAEQQSGIHVVDVGESESQDMRIWRVKWYAGLALFSEKGLAMSPGIKKPA